MNIDEQKKLAAAVAERLGEGWGEADIYHNVFRFRLDGDKWAVAGGCIDRARECGWRASVDHRDAWFLRIEPLRSAVFCEVEGHDYPLAILRAFADIPLEHFEVKK